MASDDGTRSSTGSERRPTKAEVGGSTPSGSAIFKQALRETTFLFGTGCWLVKWRGKFVVEEAE